MRNKAKIAWFSPLPTTIVGESTSISAYITNLLVPLLKNNFDIDLYHMGIGDLLGCPTLCHQRALTNHRHEPYDLLFFQIEDHPDCDFVLNYLDTTPKAILIHDINFKPNRIAPQLTHLNNALTLLFSSERNISEYYRLCKDAKIKTNNPLDTFLLPYPVETILATENFSNENLIISFCGKPSTEFRAHKLLQAIKILKFPTRLNWLLDQSDLSAAKKLLTEFEVTNAELIPNKCPNSWSHLVMTSHVAIHTLFSAYGDLGPYLPISMAAGCPVVVSNFSTGEYLPDSIVFKVNPGAIEVSDLCLILSEIKSCQNNQTLFLIKENSKKYAAEVHNHKTLAYELASIFKRCFMQENAAMLTSRSIQ